MILRDARNRVTDINEYIKESSVDSRNYDNKRKIYKTMQGKNGVRSRIVTTECDPDIQI